MYMSKNLKIANNTNKSFQKVDWDKKFKFQKCCGEIFSYIWFIKI